MKYESKRVPSTRKPSLGPSGCWSHSLRGMEDGSSSRHRASHCSQHLGVSVSSQRTFVDEKMDPQGS